MTSSNVSVNSGPCRVSGCAKPRRARGLCWTHYRREKEGLAVTGEKTTDLIANPLCSIFASLPRPRA